HFLRDLARPMLKADSHAKVLMRKKVRGLRGIEREAPRQRAQAESAKAVTVVQKAEAKAGATPRAATAPQRLSGQAASAAKQVEQGQPNRQAPEGCAAQVVLDYCAVVRGILNEDQGGPLRPTGMRMAEALVEVRASLQRNLGLNKPGPAH